MKRLLVAVMILTVALGAGGCCSIERVTVERLDASLSKQHVKYLKYVEADASLLEPQKRIERNNVASQKELLKQLLDATK